MKFPQASYKAVLCGEEVPRPIPAGTMYCQTIQGLDKPWAVFFLRPCGCGEEINIPVLDPGSWTLRLDGPRFEHPTLNPSIARLTGCKSHFFVVGGEVRW
jgi:hypothetical protein